MSKRNKKIRSNRPAFKLEALEQRQLLATIVDNQGGTEVVSDVTLANGNTYDQILMTGSTITVESDWNAATGTYNVTRVDFLDADGDLVRAEFAGPGQLTISLADFQEAAAPENYATETEYVQGVANFRITGSTDNTNFAVHSLGTVNVFNGAANPIFDGGEKTGGDNWANVSRLVIESDGGVLGNAFGGIRAGNAVFSGETGAVGIVAPEIQFYGPIIIGGLEASGSATPLLHIGQFSSNSVVTLAGTNLDGDVKVDYENVTGLVLASGQTSMGEITEVQAYEPTAFDKEADDADLANDLTYKSSALTVVLDENTTADDLEDLEDRYLNELIIEESYAESEAFADISAKMIGNITVKGDLNFKISTTGVGALSIGNVTIEGSIVDEGEIVSAKDIGDVTVKSDIDFTTDDYAAGSALISAVGNVGNVTFEDVIVNADDAVSLIIAGGNIGNISGAKLENAYAVAAVFDAGGSIGNLTFTGALTVAGAITADKNIGNISADDITTAAITADLDASGEGKIGSIAAVDALSLGALSAAKGGIGAISAGGNATLATITIVGEGNLGAISADNLTLGGAVNVANGTIGNISAAGDLAVNAAVKSTLKSIGNISVTGEGNNLSFDADGAFSAKTTIGNVTVEEGAITSANEAAEFTANKIGNVSVTGADDTAVLLVDVAFVAAGKDAVIGNVTLDASANDGAVASSLNAALFANEGTGFSSSGNIGNVTITAHEDGKLLAADTDVLLVRAGNSQMGLDANELDANANTTVSIGDVTISGDLSNGLGSGAGTGLIIVAGVEATANGVFISGTGNGTSGSVDPVSKETTGTDDDITVDGSIGAITLTDLGGSGVYGFTSNTLTADTAFSGGSVIAANSVGALTVDAGSSVSKAASGTARVGALDIDADSETTTDADLFIVVL